MVNSISTENSITLFWDKYKNSEYEISVGDKEPIRLRKTHYTIESLKPGCSYSVSVWAINKTTGERTAAAENQIIATHGEKRIIDVTKPPYSAIGDGQTLNTAALQKAMDDCGFGERVYIPEGIFLTGALRLHSNTELYIEKGAVLKGTENPNDYLPKIRSRFEGYERECYSSLLNMGELGGSGFNCENVVISGGGEICGGGRILAENIIAAETERLSGYLDSLGDKINEYEFPKTIPGRARPRLINISNCRNIVLADLTIKNGPCWNVHMVYSENIVTHGCFFNSHGVWNGDGWNPDSSKNCVIFDCDFNTGDDCVAIKSGKNPEGNVINRPCEDIKIFDCRCIMGHGICIGSEMSGGVRNVSIWDCDMENSTVGVEIKATKKRGGYVRGVYAADCSVPRIMMHSVGYNDDGEAAPEMPVFEDCLFENLIITGNALYNDGKREDCGIIELAGFDERAHFIKNVRFKNIGIGSKNGKNAHSITLRFIDGVSFENMYSL